MPEIQLNRLNINTDYTDWYVYGARFYDPVLGRFACLDPTAADFPQVSPYNYAENKPINCIDFWGLRAIQVTLGVRGALPLFGIAGVSGSFEMGLILDDHGDLVLVNAIAFGVSAGAAINVGLTYMEYPSADSYKELLGIGGDAGGSVGLIEGLSGQGNLSFSNGTKAGLAFSIGIPGLQAGLAGFADVTFTNMLKDIGVVNIKNLSESIINRIANRMGISKQKAMLLILLMRAKLKEPETDQNQIEIMLPEVVITAKRSNSQTNSEQKKYWGITRPNEFGNTGQYNRPGRSTDNYYSDNFLKWYYSTKDNK